MNLSIYLSNFFRLQIFLTIITMPILAWWGLPISLASVLGNLFFAPFIIAFLFLSSLIFFTELIHIPNGILIWLLEQLTSFWIYLLSFGSKSWLIVFPQSSCTLLFFIAFVACIAMHLKNQKYFLIINCLLLLMLSAYKIKQDNNSFLENIELQNKKACIIKTKKIITVIDLGVLKTTSLRELEIFRRKLIDGTASLKVDYLIISNPSVSSFKNLIYLAKKIDIKNILISSWNSKLTNNGWNTWHDLILIIKKYKINFYRISKDPIIIFLGDKKSLSIVAHSKPISKNNFKFRPLEIKYCA